MNREEVFHNKICCCSRFPTSNSADTFLYFWLKIALVSLCSEADREWVIFNIIYNMLHDQESVALFDHKQHTHTCN